MVGRARLQIVALTAVTCGFGLLVITSASSGSPTKPSSPSEACAPANVMNCSDDGGNAQQCALPVEQRVGAWMCPDGLPRTQHSR
jgi:hypothetical protein